MMAPDQFVLPPLPKIELAPQKEVGEATPNNVIEEWAANLRDAKKNIQKYTNIVEYESLGYMQDAIECGDGKIKTHIEQIVSAVSDLLRLEIPKLRKEVDNLKLQSRALASTRHPKAPLVVQATGEFAVSFQNSEESLVAISNQGKRIIKRFSDPDSRPENRAIKIYESALQAALRRESDVQWNLKFDKYPDEYELIPWIELTVTPEIRKNKAKKKDIEDKINNYVSEADPDLLGSIAINYKTKQ
ncbi:hypothetical protein [Gluconobacter cerinus]|uniref:hypothetical protein n=1 Tax=Gluconobacter cerinus TaxID=38307 RepID=UPI001C05400A|nr:hypothetical protein [Gluconobacter cerinus]